METIVSITIVFAVLAVLFAHFRSVFLERKKITDAIENENDEEDSFPQIQTVSFRATVIKCECGTSTIGCRSVKAIKEFLVFFEDESNKVHKFSVPEECYNGLEVGQYGNLTLNSGEFYSFELIEAQE